MTIEENKALVRRHYFEVFEQGKVELIDDYYAPNGSVPDGPTPQQWRETVLVFHKVTPGFKITILDEVAETDKVAVYAQIDCVFVGAPGEEWKAAFAHSGIVGKPISWKFLSLQHFAGGKQVGFKTIDGLTELLVKLGVYTLATAPPALKEAA